MFVRITLTIYLALTAALGVAALSASSGMVPAAAFVATTSFAG